MAKGRAKQDAYEAALQALGKDLARRAKSRCELSGERTSLTIYDLEGSKAEPSLAHVVMVSDTVLDHLAGKNLKRQELHYLDTAVWSELAPVRRTAVRVLEQIDETWARDAIDNAHSMDDAS